MNESNAIRGWCVAAAIAALSSGVTACGSDENSSANAAGATSNAGSSTANAGGGASGLAGATSGGRGGSETNGGSSAGQSSAGSAGADASAGSAGAAAGGGGAGGSSGAGGSGGAMGAKPKIPAKPAACPKIAEGNITVLGQTVRIYMNAARKKGPLLFYWHGTGGFAEQASGDVAPAISDVQANGGVVASFSTSTQKGTSSGPYVWYTGDLEMADVIAACAIDQGLVEPRRIYTSGCSAGGLQSSVMEYLRSSYLAAAMPNSGGQLKDWEFEDPAHVPALITTHGGATDFVNVSFPEITARLDQSVVKAGGFVVNCDHGGDHCASPLPVKAAQWQFLKDHPFGVAPEPYASGLPANFPAVCKIVTVK